MIRGLYTAAAGMIAGMLRHETIVHNLSNVNTTGFKADRLTVTDFPSLLLHQIYKDEQGKEVGRAGTGVTLSQVTTSFEEGPIKLTDIPFDFAINGNGFFQMQTPDGIQYTRDGRFHRDIDGKLINPNGYYVLGRNGAPITLPEGLLTVSHQGQIFVNEAQVGEFGLANFENLKEDLVKLNETMFVPREGVAAQVLAPANTNIYQGYLEDSNVDAAQGVTEMMSVLRAYEASQRMVRYQDQINGQTVTELGRV
jgi:flagellar basal-body rod protein FlgG